MHTEPVNETCGPCAGRGFISSRPCPHCGGRGIVPRKSIGSLKPESYSPSIAAERPSSEYKARLGVCPTCGQILAAGQRRCRICGNVIPAEFRLPAPPAGASTKAKTAPKKRKKKSAKKKARKKQGSFGILKAGGKGVPHSIYVLGSARPVSGGLPGLGKRR